MSSLLSSLASLSVNYSSVVGLSSTGALALLIYEYFLTLDDEVGIIWVKPTGSFIKWLYLFTRYCGVTFQIGNQILSKHVASHVPIAVHVCRLWYTWRIIASQVMLTSVEAILIIRVYALYNKSKKVAAALIFLVCCEMTLCTVNSFINIPRMEFSPACQTVLALRPVIQFGSVALVTQTSILFLTTAKQILASKTGRGRTPLVSLMIRDGAFAFLLIFGALGSTLVFLTTPNGLAFMQSWLLSILFCVGTRLIINMQRLVVPMARESSRPAQSWELTTNDDFNFPAFGREP